MLNRIFKLLLSVCFLTGALCAATDPFVGEWKLNASKSRFPDEMKVESAGANKYLFDFVGGSPETIVVDGTDQPGIFDTTLSVTMLGPDSWKVVRKKDGRILLTANWELSKDGNTLKDDFTEMGANGSSSNVKYVYKRTAGKSGFAGTWESISEQVNLVIVRKIQPYEGDGLSFINQAEEVTKSVKFDGKEYPDQGPKVAKGSVSSGRRISERTLELTHKINGKTTATDQVELSPDLKTLTMTVHVVGKPRPDILVFERQ